MTDFERKIEEARGVKPLRRLMEEHGHAPTNQNWKSFPKCPFCGKSSAGLFTKGIEFFKCFHTSCPTGGKALEEVGYLAQVMGCSRRDAAIEFLKLAGVWKEREPTPPSVMPGKAARKNKLPDGVKEYESGGSGLGSGAEEPETGHAPDPRPQTPDPNLPDPDAVPSSPHFQTERLSHGTEESPGVAGGPGVPDAPPLADLDALAEADQEIGAPAHASVTVPPPEHVPAGGTDSLSLEDQSSTESRPTLDEDTETPAIKVLREFYGRLTLDERDREELRTKRGSCDAQIDRLGFRTNCRANREILLALEKLHGAAACVASGLYEEGEGKGARPNKFFFGFGLVGKKPKAQRRHDKDDTVWGWRDKGECNPILIPYFDASGRVMRLRPHKGGVKGEAARVFFARSEEESSKFKVQSSKFAEPPEGGTPNIPERPTSNVQLPEKFSTVIITEGEFKVAALDEVLNRREKREGGEKIETGAHLPSTLHPLPSLQFGVCGLPGITLAKNYAIIEELKGWLKAVGAKRVIIAYDNEEKGVPGLPGFKEDKRQRYDAEVWGRYLAIVLGYEGLDARVARLPDDWRDDKGKADWDGALAKFKMGEEDRGEKIEGQKRSKAPSSAAIRKAFLAVLDAALPVKEVRQAGLFEAEEERIIANGVERLFYKPKLANGGDREMAVAKKLRKFVEEKIDSTESRTSMAAAWPVRYLMQAKKLIEAYEGVQGWYYGQKPPPADQMGALWKAQNEAKERARKAADGDDPATFWGLAWVIQLLMDGPPVAVANFRMECHFRLVRQDGRRDLIVTLRNIHGEQTRGICLMDAKSLTAPRDLRIWLADHGGFVWRAGERELQDLQLDLAHESAFREVHQVVAYGWHAESGLWFFDGMAIAPDAVEILPDEHGIFWHAGLGYQISDSGKDGQDWRQVRPRMRQGFDLMRSDGGDYSLSLGSGGWGLGSRECGTPNTPDPRPQTPDPKEAEFELFNDFLAQLRATLGGYSADLAMGILLAYGAAPEVYERHGAHPGLWISGEKGQGKTTVMGWLMEIWGFRGMKSGIGLLRNSTAVGLQIAAEQFSNLPVWLDEYRDHECGEDKRAIIHSGYNRELPSKWSADGRMRRIRTSFCVVGESRSRDAATMSRYPHIGVSVSARQGSEVEQRERYRWCEERRDFFFVWGRRVLRERKAFAASVMKHLAEWMDELVAGADDRARLVHGVAWAAMAAFRELYGRREDPGFATALMKMCVASAEEVGSQVNVNEFWTDVLSALKCDAFGNTRAEISRFFKVVEEESPHPPLAPNQNRHPHQMYEVPWQDVKLYFVPDAVISALRAHKRREGKDVPLSRNDLRQQMATKPYWEPWKKGKGKHQQRFAGSASPENCWCVALNRHELGYHPVSDEEFHASFYRDEEARAAGVSLPSTEWSDPRLGDLYVLAARLRQPSESNQ